MQKIALTSKGPYTGCSTIARELAKNWGFQHISMSDVLIAAYAEKYAISVDTVRKHKAHHRLALQEFGDTSGFQTDPKWIDRCLEGWEAVCPCVIEKVRTNQQAATLSTVYGFTIVEVTVSKQERIHRAAGLGVGLSDLMKAMEHPCEQGINYTWVDHTVDGEIDPLDSAALISWY